MFAKMDFTQQQKMNIIIWGCNPFSQQLHQLLEKTNIHVIAFIDDENINVSEFCNKPVYQPIKWIELKVHDVPVVIAIHHFMLFGRPLLRSKYITQFKEKLQEISNHYQICNQLLHPSALTDFLPLRFRHKPILFGLQGSGNVIFNQIFLAICKAFFPLVITRDKRTFFFEALCREYLQIIQQVVLDHIHFNDGHTLHHVAWKIGTSHFNCLFGKNNIPISIYTFTTRDHVASLTSMYHQIPSQSYLKKLQNMHFKTFFIIRNPLDMILSGLNKSGGINKETGEIDMHHFCGIASWVVKQLNAWHELSSHLNILRYEDLLISPIKTIKSMMRKLHLFPSTMLAKRIWNNLGLKQLPNAFKNHFWKGGTGKWEAFFKKEHLVILKAYGIEKVLTKYHYSDICTRFNELTTQISNEEMAPHFHLDSSHEGIYRDEYYDTYQFLIDQHGKENCVSCGSFYLVCHDSDMLNHLTSIFNNAYFNRLILAGAHADYRL